MSEKYISTAKVIDGVLILSLPDAVSPIVWQMELGQSKSSALEIKNVDEDQFVLTLKTPRQDVMDIATYSNRDQAIRALLAASQAMEHAQGQLKSAPVGYGTYPVPAINQSPSSFWPFLKRFFSFVAILFGGLVVVALALFVIGKMFISSPSTSGVTASNSPVSAEDFLNR